MRPSHEPERRVPVRPGPAVIRNRGQHRKLIGSQAASHAIERSMQTMGVGYAREFHVERLWRDARLFKFAPVSEEMILNYIAIHDLGMPKSY